MSAPASRIDEFDVIPLAFSDPPLLNAAGVHEPLALRTLVRLRVGRVVAWGEGRGDAMPPEVVAAVREAVVGEDVFATNRLDAAVDAVLRRVAPAMDSQHRLNSFAPLEVAALDAQGRLLGLPVSELLGGAVRDRVDYSAYLFFKWAGHLGEEPDGWGAAMDAAGIVRQADALIDRYGFRSIKLKAGALPPRSRSSRCSPSPPSTPACPCGSTRTARGATGPPWRWLPSWATCSSTSRIPCWASRA
ncbi:hypothetical protein GCM10025874_11390 [Arenivirga flava]|uniref:Mandelate racemase/muconate lactonizing enzyme N-terminal domain-containing protein n=1 Tax=Arenivirga flava TaxID=1930060 RepID=A0AA37XB14_9MICO|nr:hypothetical protein GCM10025874_11390 [Arenivirga flava]